MAYSKQVIEKVKDELEARRKNALQTLEDRKREMYAECPVLKEIDDALSATGLKVYKAALMGKNGLEERIEALKKENLELQENKRSVLKLCGKPENYLDLIYSCPKCSDTGYQGSYMCDCMKKALSKEAFLSSGLGAVLDEQTFDSFDLNLYSDVKKNDGASPREHMAYILEKSREYANSFGAGARNNSLLFIGKTGLGKTHLSSAIAKVVIEKGYDVVYDSIGSIVNTYEQQTFGHSEDASAMVARYLECDLLIIDDLGTEFKNSFTQATIYSLLNSRINNGKAMIVSTNLDDDELFKKQYDDRITSRLIGSFRPLKFYGEDIRIKKTIMQNKK